MTDEARVEDATSDGEWICRWTCTCGDHGLWQDTKGRLDVQRDKDAHRARHARIDTLREQQLRAAEVDEDEQAHADGDLCGDHSCPDCWGDGGAENASEDHLIDSIREGWIR